MDRKKVSDETTRDSFISGNSEDVTSGHVLSDCLKLRGFLWARMSPHAP